MCLDCLPCSSRSLTSPEKPKPKAKQLKEKESATKAKGAVASGDKKAGKSKEKRPKAGIKEDHLDRQRPYKKEKKRL